MNKKLISSLLIVAVLNLPGCYTYTAISKEDIQNNHPISDDAFIIVLKDGSEIEYDIEEYPQAVFVRVDEPSDFYFGSGRIFDKENKKEAKFWGKIDRDIVDSTKIAQTGNDLYRLFWLNNNTRITFKIGEYFNISPEDSTGYWIVGKRGNGMFSGKIVFSDIVEIQGRNMNQVVNIGLIVIGIGVFVYLLAGIAAYAKSKKSISGS